MTASLDTEGRGGTLVIEITGENDLTDGGVGAVLNPWGVDVLILRATLYVGTPSTGAANLSAGVAADSHSNVTDIVNALAVNGAITGKVYNGHVMQNGAKTEIAAPVVWQDGYYVDLTGSADTTGLVGKLFLECIPLN